MRKRRESEGEEAEERWLLPYADMITLLLGLFIVLFAMSSIDSNQYNEVRRSLSQ
ncbi:MAG: flagellar motor protein MotB, partial [Gaiellales bacterium]